MSTNCPVEVKSRVGEAIDALDTPESEIATARDLYHSGLASVTVFFNSCHTVSIRYYKVSCLQKCMLDALATHEASRRPCELQDWQLLQGPCRPLHFAHLPVEDGCPIHQCIACGPVRKTQTTDRSKSAFLESESSSFSGSRESRAHDDACMNRHGVIDLIQGSIYRILRTCEWKRQLAACHCRFDD